MIRWSSLLLPPAAAGLFMAMTSAPGQGLESPAELLNVSRMQTFTDIGSDGKTKPELVADFKEIGGNAIKVVFFKGDSIGDRVAKVKNWNAFATLHLSVFNPGREAVSLGLNIFHARSTNYATRIEVPIDVKPGKNKSGALDKTKYTLDETVRGQAHGRVKNLLDSYPVYPEIDLPFLAESLGIK